MNDTDSTNVSKQDLINYIKEWLQIEKELKEIQKIAREKRDRKKALTNSLVNIMKSNEIECFDINNGKLLYTQNKVKHSLNKAYLLSSLTKYFENDSSQADLISNFIMENREIKIKEGIRFK